MRVLITGAGGFVGSYLADALRNHFKNDVTLVLTSQDGFEAPHIGTVEALDVTDPDAVEDAIKRVGPDSVVHLAGLAAVTAASANMDLAWKVHLNGSLNVAHAIMKHVPQCSLLYIGSGQIYGASARGGAALTEASLLAPTNVYGATKASADLAIGALAEAGLRCIRLRPFNHIGPGQSEDFAIPSFAMQIARIESSLAPPIVRVGNLEAERDFLDVRDVAAAYVQSIVHADTIANGTILNIASGVPHRMSEILGKLLALSKTSISVEEDSSRMRPSDTPHFIGDATKARKLLGWAPKFSLDDTLADVLDYSRTLVSRSQRLG
jgi:GDP-4-dehydro-6-deoxy-D-mannose reductase